MKKIIMRSLSVIVMTAAVCFMAGCPRMDKGGGSSAALGALTADDMVFQGLDGKEVNLKELADGRPIYASFFASWCRICVDEIPRNNEIFKKYADRGLLVYGINVNESLGTVQSVIKKKGIEYPVVRFEKSADSAAFSVTALPLIMLFDSDGKQVYMGPAPPGNDVIENLIASVSKSK